MGQRPLTPREYLARMPLWESVFGPGTAPEVMGYTSDGRIITRQAYAQGIQPSQAEVDEAVSRGGFYPVRRSMFLWKKDLSDGRALWLGDARDDNFVKEPNGRMVPIDVRLWVTNPGQDQSWMEH